MATNLTDLENAMPLILDDLTPSDDEDGLPEAEEAESFGPLAKWGPHNNMAVGVGVNEPYGFGRTQADES